MNEYLEFIPVVAHMGHCVVLLVILQITAAWLGKKNNHDYFSQYWNPDNLTPLLVDFWKDVAVIELKTVEKVT